MFHYGLADELIKIAVEYRRPKLSPGAVAKLRAMNKRRNERIPFLRAYHGMGKKMSSEDLAHHARMKGELGYITRG